MEPERSLEHSKHVVRAALMLLVVIVALVLGRSLFVPPTWGESGWYRGASPLEHRDMPVRHGGDTAREMCHSEQSEIHIEGVHHSVRCELCHAPVAVHVDMEEGEKLADMPTRRSRELCENCHTHLVGRPAEFPQIDPKQHVVDNGGELTADACFDCHDPHSPF
jgi:hypothetical protein